METIRGILVIENDDSSLDSSFVAYSLVDKERGLVERLVIRYRKRRPFVNSVDRSMRHSGYSKSLSLSHDLKHPTIH